MVDFGKHFKSVSFLIWQSMLSNAAICNYFGMMLFRVIWYQFNMEHAMHFAALALLLCGASSQSHW